MDNRLSQALEYLLDLVYPPVCMVCMQIIAIDKPRWLCDICEPLLLSIEKNACIKCGRPMENENMTCGDCAGGIMLERNYALFVYDVYIRRIIHNLKYLCHPEFARGIGRIIRQKADLSVFDGVDIITCVPMHAAKRRKRGFNQAALIAKEISAITGLPFIEHLIFRQKNTSPQNKLSRQARQSNLEKAFVVNKKFTFTSKQIVIIDDIYTTGSTMNACAGVLLNAGAASVRGFTLSIAVRDESSGEDFYGKFGG